MTTAPDESAHLDLGNVEVALIEGRLSLENVQEMVMRVNAQREATAVQAKNAAMPIPAVHLGETPEPRVITRWEALSELMGGQDGKFFGPDSLKNLRGIDIYSDRLPKLSISEARAQNAKDLGHMISLHSDKLASRRPNTMLQFNFDNAGRREGRILYNSNGTDYLPGGLASIPDRLEWRQTSIECIPGTYRKDYLQQTAINVDFLKNNVSKGQMLSLDEQAAIAEFEQHKPALEFYIANPGEAHPTVKLANGKSAENWYVAGEILTNLKITQLTRPTLMGIINDIETAKRAGIPMLRNKYTYTSARTPYGSFLGVGGLDNFAADIRSWLPYDGSRGDVGACFSQNHTPN